MKRILIAFIIFHSSSLIGFAQQTNLDSLWSVWTDEELADTIRLEAISRLAMPGFVFSNPDSAFKLAELQYAYAEKIENNRFMASALNIQGVAYAMQSNYPKSIDYFLLLKKMHEETGNKRGIANVLNNLGRVYDGNHEYNKSMEMYIECLAILEDLDDEKGMMMPLINLGFNYANRGDLEAALESLNRAYDIAVKYDNKRGVFDSMAGIGYCYELKNDLQTALEYSLKTLELSKQIGPELSIVQMLNSVGKYYQQLGESKKAIAYCKEGLERAQKATSLASQKNSCDCLYNAYKAINDHETALEYHERFLIYKDSIFNEENTKELTRLEMQYEFDKQQAAEQAEQERKDTVVAAELHREKIIRNGLIVGFVVVLLFAIIFFGQRNKIGKEKERSDRLLLNILPEEVANELKLKGESEAKDFDNVTVLFTDFVEFTQTAENLTAKELVSEINVCFKAFDEIITKYQLEKIKTIGDAYMAAGGLHVPRTSEPKDVVKAALEMQAFMINHKAARTAQNLPAFDMRVGIHTGPVVAGIVGVKKFQYDIWGDTVNTASRMESSGEVGKVNISQATYELLKDASTSSASTGSAQPALSQSKGGGNGSAEFVFESRGKIKAKGKGEMEMLFVSLKK